MKWSQAAIRYRLSYISELTIRLFSKIRQGSKINGLWETGRSPIKQNVFDSFWQKGIYFVRKISPSFPRKCEGFFQRVISYNLYIILYLILLILEN